MSTNRYGNEIDPASMDHADCVDFGRSSCVGDVEFHSLSFTLTESSAFPRCEKHWGERLDRAENSMERYADSDVAPAWFDPTYAGERWSDDY